MTLYSDGPKTMISLLTGADRNAPLQAAGGLISRGDCVFATSPAGDLVNQYFDPVRGDSRLSPFEPGSKPWNPLGEIQSQRDIHELAYSLFPDAGIGADRELRDCARTFFIDMIRRLWEMRMFRLQNDLPETNYPTVDGLYYSLTQEPVRKERRDDIGLENLLKGTGSEILVHEENVRLLSSVRAVIASTLRCLSYHNDPTADALSVRAWVRQCKVNSGCGPVGALFVPYRVSEISALRSLIPTWVRLCLFEALECPVGDRRLWLIFDGADSFHRVHGLEDVVMSMHRFGVHLVLGIESMERFADLYGRDASVILEAAKTPVP